MTRSVSELTALINEAQASANWGRVSRLTEERRSAEVDRDETALKIHDKRPANFFFVRRMPRSAEIVCSSCSPMIARVGGGNPARPKYRLQWRSVPRDAFNNAQLKIVRGCAGHDSSGYPVVNLEAAAERLSEEGLEAEFHPARETSNGGTRPAFVKVYR